MVSPTKFFYHHWYPNETWYTYSLLTWLYDVLVFYTIFEEKNLAPPMDLAFFCGFPNEIVLSSMVSQWNLVYLLIIQMALWRFSFLPNLKKKSRPSYGLSIFLWFPNEFFLPITGIPMKLGVPTHSRHEKAVISHIKSLRLKKSAPPSGLNPKKN